MMCQDTNPGGVRATTAMHAGICFGFVSFAHGGHRVRISCERQNYFFPFKISQLL